MQESGYNLGAKRTQCGYDSDDETKTKCIVTDYGIAQVHFKNLTRFGLDKDRLLNDLAYSIDAGGMIMSQYVKFRKHEPDTWTCRYNQGVASFYKIQQGCAVYLTSISRWY